MWRIQSFSQALFTKFGKLIQASAAPITTDAVLQINKEKNDPGDISLMWIDANLSGQNLPVMIDTGATPNCVASRCVLTSPIF